MASIPGEQSPAINMLHPEQTPGAVNFLRPGAVDTLTTVECTYPLLHDGEPFMKAAYDFVASDGYLYTGNGEKIFLRDHLIRLNVPLEDINRMTTIEGKVKPIETIENPYKMEPLEAGRWVIKQVRDFYSHNAATLHDDILHGKDGVDGFNDHREHHIQTVLERSLGFLEQMQQFRGDIDKEEFLVTAIGAAIHDLGNILSRKYHARISPLLAEKLLPVLTTNPRLWEKIKRIAIFHNEPELSALFSDVWHTGTNAKKTIKLMAKHFSPSLLAVIMADKLHIGPDRLPNIWKDPKGVLRDWRIAFNAALIMRKAAYTPDGRRFIINFEYNPGLMEGDVFADLNREPLLRRSNKHPEGWVPMPDAIHQYLRDGKASHSEVLEAIMWTEDGHKGPLREAIMAAFAANPHTRKVEVNIFDESAKRDLEKYTGLHFSDRRIQQIMHRKYIFTRGNIDRQIARIERRFKRKDIDLEKLREERTAAKREAISQFRRPVRAPNEEAA